MFLKIFTANKADNSISESVKDIILRIPLTQGLCLQEGAPDLNNRKEESFNTDKKVITYANEHGRLGEAAKYITPGDYDVVIGEHINTESGAWGSEFAAVDGENGTMYLDPHDFGSGSDFNAERFYYAAWHEGHHRDMLVSAWQKDGIGSSLKNWASGFTEDEWSNHQYAQEYINTDPARIRYYDQMSPSTIKYIQTLTDRARNNGYRRMLNYYIDLGY